VIYRKCRFCAAVIADNDDDARQHAEWHAILQRAVPGLETAEVLMAEQGINKYLSYPPLPSL
jgi:hypothetical protein